MKKTTDFKTYIVMRKIFLAVLFAALFSTALGAQEYYDVVYLKNGSRVKGIIVEQVPGQSYKIQTSDGNLFVFNADEVEKITKEAKQVASPVQKSAFNRPRGYFGNVEVQYTYDMTAKNNGTFGLDMVNGYRICPQFAMGVGIGFQGYDFKNFQLPVYAYLRTDIINSKVSPFLAQSIGYEARFYGQDIIARGMIDGVMFNTQVGVSFNVGKRNRASLAFQYKSTKLNDRWRDELGVSLGFSL